MRRYLFILLLLFVPIGSKAQSWTFVQDASIFFCQGTVTGCSGGSFVGNMTPTVAGSVWVLMVQGNTNFTITSVTGGGGNWVHCPNCHANAIPNGGFNVDAWYNLCISGGTACTTGENGSHLAFTLSQAAGVSVNFWEFLPPTGSTASFDTSGTATPASCSGSSPTPCQAASVTLSATDIVIQNPGGFGQASWNAWSVPYITSANGSGWALNVTGTSAPTVTGIPNFGNTYNPEFFAIAFKSSLGTFTPPALQYSIKQIVTAQGPAAQSGGGQNCSSGCNVSLAQATTAGDLLYVQGNSGQGALMTALTCAPVACNSGASAAVIPTGNSSSVCQRTYNGIPGIPNAALSCGYVLSIPSGVTSINVKASSSLSFTITAVEVASTIGSFSLDVQGSTQITSNCATCAGQTLTFTGSNDVLFGAFWVEGGGDLPSYLIQPNLGWYCSGSGASTKCNSANYTMFNQAEMGILTDTGPTQPSYFWVNPQNTTSLVTGIAFTAKAPTINAVDCTSANVQAALNQVAADGTTVVIPACASTTWSTLVTYNETFSTIVQGQTNCTPSTPGSAATSCTDNTIIKQGIAGNNAILSVNVPAGKSFRITGMTFDMTGSTSFVTLAFGGQSQAFRLDHSHIANIPGGFNSMVVNGLTGVIDHIVADGGNNSEFMRPFADNWRGVSDNCGGGCGNASWAAPAVLGGPDFIFLEDSSINGTGPNGLATNDCYEGGRYVVRHNVMNDTSTQGHTTGHAGDSRGCRAQELYANTYPAPAGGIIPFNAMDLETGPAVVWGNTVSQYGHFMTTHDKRANNVTYTQSAPPGGWGYAGNTFNGSTSAWDQNSVTTTGYAALDQVGRGQGDFLSGLFPSKCNLTQNPGCNIFTGQWPRQSLEPAYIFANTWTCTGTCSGFFNTIFDPQVGTNRDIFMDVGASCGGTACTTGVGVGPVSSRPASCTPNSVSFVGPYTGVLGGSPGVGWWDPNTTTLYVCTATNTWTQFYQPYTYPHPLQSSGTGSPAVSLSPSSLVFTSQLVGTSSSKLVTLTNTGTASLTITSISVAGSNATSWSQLNNCGSSLGVGLNCTITVTFSPVTPGSLPASVSVVSNSPTSPDIVTMSGFGLTSVISGTGSISGNAVIKVNP